jgi:hypothetical protein
MSYIIRKNTSGNKLYEGFSQENIQKAEELLNQLITELNSFQTKLENSENLSSIDRRYRIGRFLDSFLNRKKINQFERLFLWDEIKNFTNSELQQTKDRSDKQGFYEYCYRLAQYNEIIVFKFTWRQWSELLDRSVILKDDRLLLWLSNNITDDDDFRLFLLIINHYLKKFDTTVFRTNELFYKYDQIFEIVKSWNYLLNKYFDYKEKKNLRKKLNLFNKNKKQFCIDCLNDLIQKKMTLDIEIYEEYFKAVFLTELDNL